MKKLSKFAGIILKNEKLIPLIIVVLVLILCSAVDIFAKETVVAMNMYGEYIFCEDEYYDTPNSVTFIYDGILDKNSCLCVLLSQNGGGDFSEIMKLDDSEFILNPTEEETYCVLKFNIYDSIEDKYYEIDLEDKYYYIHFVKDKQELVADFSASIYDQENGVYFLSGEKPVLDLIPKSDVTNMVSVTKNGEEQLFSISAETKFEFEEGEYSLNVYTIDEKGNIISADGFPINFVYDITPPENAEFYIYGGSAKESDEDVILSNEALRIAIVCEDELSGVDDVIICSKNERIHKSEIKLPVGYSGDLSVYAIDKCGNVSDKFKSNKKYIIENEPPSVEVTKSDGSAGFSVDIKIKDEMAGLNLCDIYADGNLLRSEEYSNKEIYERTINVYTNDMINSSKGVELRVVAVDNAGNEIEYYENIKPSDNTPPNIIIDGVYNNGVYSKSVNVNMDISDDSGYLQDVEIIVECADEEGCIKTTNYRESDSLYFEDEGKYSLKVKACDASFNTSEAYTKFVIDKSAPLIKGLELFDGKYLPEFSIKDMIGNMFSDMTLVDYKLYLNGDNFDKDSVVCDDGHYTFSVIAKDLAGNMSANQAEFVVYTVDDEKVKNDAKNIKNNNEIIDDRTLKSTEKSLETKPVPKDLDDENATKSISVHDNKFLIYLTLSAAVFTLAGLVVLLCVKWGKSKTDTEA